MKIKNKLLLYLRVFISIGLIIVLCFFMRGRFGELMNTLRSVNLGLFLWAVALAGFILVISAFRLKLLFEIHGIYFSGIEAIRISYMGVFFNNFMPSTIGGDVVKLYYAKKRAKNLIEPISSLVMDRILGLTALTFLGAAALMFKSELMKDNTAKFIIMVISLIISVFFVLLFFKGFSLKVVYFCKMFKLVKTEAWIIKLVDTMSSFRKSSKIFAAFFCALFGQVVIIFCIYILSRSLLLNLPIATFYVLIPVIQIVSALPSINGLGIREGAFVYFFKDFIAPEYAVALSILYLGIMIPLSIAGGFVYMFYGKINTREVESYDQ